MTLLINSYRDAALYPSVGVGSTEAIASLSNSIRKTQVSNYTGIGYINKTLSLPSGMNNCIPVGASDFLVYGDLFIYKVDKNGDIVSSNLESTLYNRFVVYANGILITFGYNSTTIKRSLDLGQTWANATNVSSITIAATGCSAYGNGIFVCVMNNGTCLRSIDNGVTWTSTTVADWNGKGFTSSLVFHNGKFIFCSYTSLYTSADGITWTQQVTARDFGNGAVAYNDNIVLILTGNGTDNHALITNDGGTTYTVLNVPSRTVGNPFSVSMCYFDGYFWQGINAGYSWIQRSTDGIIWISVSLNSAVYRLPRSTNDGTRMILMDNTNVSSIIASEKEASRILNE